VSKRIQFEGWFASEQAAIRFCELHTGYYFRACSTGRGFSVFREVKMGQRGDFVPKDTF
jgi:hypothetical protein